MKIPIVTGPTASGKSSAAFDAAYEIGAEIISADAFQVYKGLDIGTAKSSVTDRNKVVHHLIDIINPDECYSAGIFFNKAEEIIGNILAKGKTPIIAGGTGLYIKSLTSGFFDCPPIDKNIRQELQKKAESKGLLYLYSELSKIDPEYAVKIEKQDPIRIIRALEVYYGLGVTFSHAHKLFHKKPKYEYIITALNVDRSSLYDNINNRTILMWDQGWKDEVAALINKGYTKDMPSFRAIGYRLIADFLLNGGDENWIITQIAKETRHFAKRQLTWFRHQENINILYNHEKLVQYLIDLYK